MALLDEPVTTKLTDYGENERLQYAVSAMQGRRDTMEDAHVTLGNLHVETATSFFAVFDGHGGPAVARFCANHLHTELLNHRDFYHNLPNAVRATFLRMDELMKQPQAGTELSEYGGNEYWEDYKEKKGSFLFRCLPCVKPSYKGPMQDGCTACVALIRGNQIIVGNAGDSRCIISRNGQAIVLSTDHKADLEAERDRIVNSGHAVTHNPDRGTCARIDDGIAISRALGDLRFKNRKDLVAEQQAVTALPEVRAEVLTADTEFLVLACDGVWDNMTNQEVVAFVRERLDANQELAIICENILDLCVNRPRGYDNMSVILVRFRHPALAGGQLPAAIVNNPVASPSSTMRRIRSF